MKCTEIRAWLPALAGGELGRAERAACEAHLAGCTECGQRLAQLQDAISLMRDVGQQQPLPADFRASLHRRLAAQPPPARPLLSRVWHLLEQLGLDSGPRLGMAAAASALVLGIVVASPLLRTPPSSSSTGPVVGSLPAPHEEVVAASFRVPERRVAVVHLDFVADVSVADVEFEVTLPSELHFIDDGKPREGRTLQWRGSLAVGSNPIPLAVRSSKPGRYRVTAQARGEGIDVRHDILLEVVSS